MATVNFSVPQDVKEAFDRAFKNRNKSAILTELMRKAVAEADLGARRVQIFQELEATRHLRPSLTNEQIRRARQASRG